MSDLFDKEALLDGIDGDIEFLEETLDMLDEDSGALLEQCRSAAEARDAEALVKPAHALKGMVGNFCAGPAQEAARAVEFMGREANLKDAAAAVTALCREVEQLKAALHAFLKELQS
jgi:HPt (histidine-containing phosphotransfer) domain-containing protein